MVAGLAVEELPTLQATKIVVNPLMDEPEEPTTAQLVPEDQASGDTYGDVIDLGC